MNAVWYRREVDDPRRRGRAGECCCTSRRWTTTRRSGSTASRSAATAAASRRSPATSTASRGRARRRPSSSAPATTTGRAAAARQAVAALRELRLHLHPHHRHLADGLAGAGARTCALRRPRITPDVANGTIRLEQPLSGSRAGLRLRATLRDAERRGLHGRAARPTPTSRRASTCRSPKARRRLWSPRRPAPLRPRASSCSTPTARVVDRATQLRRPAQRHHRRQGDQAQRRGGLPAPGARPGLLPRRHLTAPSDEALRARHRAEPGRRLQRRAPAPEGLRGALPLPRRPAGLPRLGRVRRLGLRAASGPRTTTSSRRDLHHAVAGGARARLLAPVHHRLVPAERDLAADDRPRSRGWTT